MFICKQTLRYVIPPAKRTTLAHLLLAAASDIPDPSAEEAAGEFEIGRLAMIDGFCPIDVYLTRSTVLFSWKITSLVFRLVKRRTATYCDRWEIVEITAKRNIIIPSPVGKEKRRRISQ